MQSFDEKLSRISALQPPRKRRHGSEPGPPDPSDNDEITSMLRGTVQHNSLGCHLFLRRSFRQPAAETIDRRALDLLLPEYPDEACDPGNWLFLDTETTGLSGGTGTYAFLVGVGWWETGRFVVEQFFMRDHSEESSLLLGLLERIRRRPVLVTFNGKSFDWPLLETRYRMTRAGMVREPLAHLDLLYPSRRLWRLHLDSVALTHLETRILGFDRGRDIPSETIPRIYFDFLRRGSLKGIADVLHHNRMDICGLGVLALRILEIFADPEHSDCRGSELFGVSRILQQSGDTDRAERLYRMAIERGLPESAERIAKKELALAAKRRRDFTRSNALWENLLGDTVEGLKAYEQLAVYYEHHIKDPRRAANLSREALVRLREAYSRGRILSSQYMRLYTNFHHRLSRLTSKIGCQDR